MKYGRKVSIGSCTKTHKNGSYILGYSEGISQNDFTINILQLTFIIRIQKNMIPSEKLLKYCSYIGLY